MADTSSWSKQYYEGLTDREHAINDAWFRRMLGILSDVGVLVVPGIQKVFNKRGEEVKES